MAAEPSAVEQVISRTLRDNLARIQRTCDELNQAMSDLVSACGSSRPTNALPPMVRAQASAASLSASLEVLSRFVTAALQPALRSPLEQEILSLTSVIAAEPSAPVEQPEPTPAHLIEERVWDAPEPVRVHIASEFLQPEFSQSGPPRSEAPVEETETAEAAPPVADVSALAEPLPEPVTEREPEIEPEVVVETQPESAAPHAEPVFALDSLPPEEQELHRRAYRVAKVSMQDIKMLRPEDVRIGRENNDLCFRLRDDIDKAHKEYDRRFQSIGSHPVDYFYDWMVEILAGGNPEALGEYPYPSPVLRR